MASSESSGGRATAPSGRSYKRIATEEAFATPELFEGYRRILASGIDDPGFVSL